MVYTRNPGAAFSLGTGLTIVFSLVAVAVIVVIVRHGAAAGAPWAGRSPSAGCSAGRSATSPTACSESPAPLRGSVVDWIEVPHWPVFNLADSAIVCSAVLMVGLTLRGVQPDGSRLG